MRVMERQCEVISHRDMGKVNRVESCSLSPTGLAAFADIIKPAPHRKLEPAKNHYCRPPPQGRRMHRCSSSL